MKNDELKAKKYVHGYMLVYVAQILIASWLYSYDRTGGGFSSLWAVVGLLLSVAGFVATGVNGLIIGVFRMIKGDKSTTTILFIIISLVMTTFVIPGYFSDLVLSPIFDPLTRFVRGLFRS